MDLRNSAAENYVDVIVIGAGISGIGAGYHMQTMCPDRTYTILEGRQDLGGTWDLFRYPGVRSDSDMHTLGFSWSPWTDPKSIADGPSILKYVRETAAKFGIDKKIRYGHQITNARWSSADSTWTVTGVQTGPDGTTTPVELHSNFLFMCAGYYSYKGGHKPTFEGSDDFEGQILHPQEWPDDLDYSGKRVAVIGSGATAMTLVPAMTDAAEHVTMIQRSPTYVVARPDEDVVANTLRKVLPEKVAYKITRQKNIRLGHMMYRKTRDKPEEVKEQLLKMVREQLPNYDVDTHFTPSYYPWDQRLCLIPNADLFEAIKADKASVVTDHIDRFTKTGVLMESGEEVAADIIVTATGLKLVTLGEMEFEVDGVAVDFSKTWTYKGVAYSDIPNLASSFGYINASWTLRSDMICDWVCRVLNHMAETGSHQMTPRLRPSDATMEQRPWIADFPAGYMQRTMDELPRQGDKEPWVNTQSYLADIKLIKKSGVDDDVLTYTRTRQPTPVAGA